MTFQQRSLKNTPLITLSILAVLLSACAGSNNMNMAANNSMVQTAAPVDLIAQGRNTANSTVTTTAALPPTQSIAPVMMVPVKRSLNQRSISRSIRNYQISKNLPVGSYRVMGADLNSNGKGEAIVLFTGEQWCAPTGCTLAIFRKTDRGYRIISTTRRVKAPIYVARSSAYGWRGLTVDTGIKDKTLQSVELTFNGSRYQGNATLVQRIPGRGGDKGELLIGADANPLPKVETQLSQAVQPSLPLRASKP